MLVKRAVWSTMSRLECTYQISKAMRSKTHNEKVKVQESVRVMTIKKSQFHKSRKPEQNYPDRALSWSLTQVYLFPWSSRWFPLVSWRALRCQQGQGEEL